MLYKNLVLTLFTTFAVSAAALQSGQVSAATKIDGEFHLPPILSAHNAEGGDKKHQHFRMMGCFGCGNRCRKSTALSRWKLSLKFSSSCLAVGIYSLP